MSVRFWRRNTQRQVFPPTPFMLQNNLHVNKLTSGHANFRMLSPSVCRLTLPLPALCRDTSSLVFPCTSLEIGRRSAAFAERSSASPSSLFEALTPENGHSPESFSSFSLAQNIFGSCEGFSLLPLSSSFIFSLPLLSHFRERQMWWSSCWSQHLVVSSRRCLRPLCEQTRGFKWSFSPKGSQYSVKAAWTTDGWEPSLTESQWGAGEKNQAEDQSVRNRGWCGLSEGPISQEKSFPSHCSHAK